MEGLIFGILRYSLNYFGLKLLNFLVDYVLILVNLLILNAVITFLFSS